MAIEKNKVFTVIALSIILAISAGAHFYRIDYPAAPVFDEAHFATYAADYTTHQAFFDIHPAIGKLLYAAVFMATGKHPAETQFVVETYDHLKKTIDDHGTGAPYGDFPYVPLRDLSAIFGILLPLALYWFLRNIGTKNLGALLATFLAALENALITQTRLILLDGFLWVFALIALALYFSKRPRPVISGIFFGLALGVKLSAIVFAGPILIYCALVRFKNGGIPKVREEKKKMGIFAFMSFVLLACIMIVNSLLFSLNDQITALNATLGYSLQHVAAMTWEGKTGAFAKVVLAENMTGMYDYVTGNQNPNQSPWYLWPAKQTPMIYFKGDAENPFFQNNVVFDGNPITWYASTLAVLLGLALAWKFWRSPSFKPEERRPFFILLGSYLITLAPFAIIVHRSTFLYHYLPSLIFAISLLGWLIAYALKLDDFNTLTKKQGIPLLVICIAVVAGFLFAAPGTYGL